MKVVSHISAQRSFGIHLAMKNSFTPSLSDVSKLDDSSSDELQSLVDAISSMSCKDCPTSDVELLVPDPWLRLDVDLHCSCSSKDCEDSKLLPLLWLRLLRSGITSLVFCDRFRSGDLGSAM